MHLFNYLCIYLVSSTSLLTIFEIVLDYCVFASLCHAPVMSGLVCSGKNYICATEKNCLDLLDLYFWLHVAQTINDYVQTDLKQTSLWQSDWHLSATVFTISLDVSVHSRVNRKVIRRFRLGSKVAEYFLNNVF